MQSIKRIIIHKKTGKRFLVKDLTDNFHTQFGMIKKAQLKNNSATSEKGHDFIILKPIFSDLWDNLNRGPQSIIQKDIGLILAKTGINKESKVVDAGGGIGALSLSLANICKEVTVYEINPEHYKIVQKNISLLGAKNITVRQENIYDNIKEKDLDLITLDLPEPWQVIEHAEKSLKTGGHLVIYLPNLTQVQTFLNATRKSQINPLETIELIERKWKITDKIMRPEFQMLGHTGFLIFCRKLK
ncbi:methyltransferase [Candidatus Woesearchaeota archaeon]|jgi:tRNA (adenine57-N1/adenine58-N1)-methyltransferase catalytic subunit|nr:methyltransferase [Candidatus Woesearchaeota archaeon]MBT5740567.1 methyltransferase [Candidatus Woesearchaeota archaeon]